MFHPCIALWLIGIFFAVFMLMTMALLTIEGTGREEYRPALFPIWHIHTPEDHTISLVTYNNDYVLAMFVFYISGIALILYRIFRRNIFTVISHGLMHLTVLYTLIFRIFMPFEHEESNFLRGFPVPYYFLAGLYATQCTLALFLVICHRNRSHRVRKACRRFHAFLGLITYTVLMWNFTMHASKLSANYIRVRQTHRLAEPWVFLLLGLLFMLLVLFVLFMPIFEKKRNRRAVQENVEIPHTVYRGQQPQVVTKQFPSNAPHE